MGVLKPSTDLRRTSDELSTARCSNALTFVLAGVPTVGTCVAGATPPVDSPAGALIAKT